MDKIHKARGIKKLIDHFAYYGNDLMVSLLELNEDSIDELNQLMQELVVHCKTADLIPE